MHRISFLRRHSLGLVTASVLGMASPFILPVLAADSAPAPAAEAPATPPPAKPETPPGYHPDPGHIELPPPVLSVKMKPELAGVHPRIFMTNADVLAMREKIKDPTFQPMWENFLRWTDHLGKQTPPANPPIWDDPFRGFGNSLPSFAFAYLVSQDPKYLEYARKWMDAVAGYPAWASDIDLGAAHCAFGLGLAYDWLYNDLTPDERKKIEEALTRHSRLLLQRSLMSPGSWWGYSYFQNHCWINHTGVAVAAMATYETDPAEKQEWLDFTRDKFQPTYKELGLDGGYYEGPAYMGYGTAWALSYIEALKSISGEDLSDMTYLKKASRHTLDMMMPGGLNMANFGDTDPWGWGLPDQIQVWFASRNKDSYAEWLRQKNRQAVKDFTGHAPPLADALGMLWFDPSVTATPPDDLPTTGIYPDLGIVTFRTSWKDDAAMVAFHCGPPGGQHLADYCGQNPKTNVNFGHQHPGAGNFLFWSEGLWRVGLPGAYTHDKKTQNENVWIVNGKGQRGEAEWMEAKSYIGAPTQAHLVAVGTSKEADYVVGEAAPAYEADAHLTSFKRHLLFVKGSKPYVVVYDTLVADQPVKWTSYLHTFDPVEILGKGRFEIATQPQDGTSPEVTRVAWDANASSSSTNAAPMVPIPPPASTNPTFGDVFGPEGLTQEVKPLIVLAHPKRKPAQRGYEIATANPEGTATWQITVVTTDKSPVKMTAPGAAPKVSVGKDKIEWAIDGTVKLNGKVLKTETPKL